MQSIEWRSSNVRRDFKAALFDFDGTISLIREGWQPIMYSYFTKVLSEVSPNEAIASLETLVREFVDDLTGKQTIYQCIRLAEEVERRGVKPEDPFAYKDEYNRRLLRHISHRVQALQSGEADPEEYLVPGSVELLEGPAPARLNLVSGQRYGPRVRAGRGSSPRCRRVFQRWNLTVPSVISRAFPKNK